MAFEIHEISANQVLARHALKLAGHNFIHAAWVNLGNPFQGWVAQNAFINKELHSKHPSSNELKILISTMNYDFYVEEIWGWTYGNNGKAEWTPLLFVGKEVRQNGDKIEILENHLYQFMYLQGDDAGWIFGAGGPNTSPLLFNSSFDWFCRAIK